MEKEPLFESSRFRVALSTVILEILILAAPALGLSADPELLQTVALAIAGVVSAFIYSRGLRNTP